MFIKWAHGGEPEARQLGGQGSQKSRMPGWAFILYSCFDDNGHGAVLLQLTVLSHLRTSGYGVNL